MMGAVSMVTQRNVEGAVSPWHVFPWPQYSFLVTKIVSSLIVMKISVVQFGTRVTFMCIVMCVPWFLQTCSSVLAVRAVVTGWGLILSRSRDFPIFDTAVSSYWQQELPCKEAPSSARVMNAWRYTSSHPVQLELHHVEIGNFKFPGSKGAVTTL
jgi:hypothetical protein